jgi:WD40 repeat protein
VPRHVSGRATTAAVSPSSIHDDVFLYHFMLHFYFDPSVFCFHLCILRCTSPFSWPLYVHSFLFLLRNNHVSSAAEFLDTHAQEHEPQHSDSIKRLRQCSSFNHASDSVIGAQFLGSRYIIRVSASSFELLLMFLDVRRYSLLRHFVQDYLDLRVVSQKPRIGSVALEGTSKHFTIAHWPHEDNIENSDGVVLDPTLGLSHPLRSVATDKLRELSQASEAVAETQVENPWVCMYTLFNPAANVTSMCIAQNGSSVVAAFEDGCFRHWDLSISGAENSEPPLSASLRPEFGSIFKGHSASIYSLDSFLGGRMILSASEDGTVMLWDMLLKSRLAIYRAHNLPVWGVSVSPGGFYFATFGRDGTARLWSTDCGNYLRLYVGHLADVCCAAWHPNCEYLITGSEDCTLRMFEVQTGNCVRLMIGHTSPVVSVSCSPDGSIAISAAENGEVIMWDLGSGQPVSTLGQHRESIICFSIPSCDLAFAVASATSCHFPSGSSSCAVTASIDGCVKIWDIKTARAMAQPEGDARCISFLCLYFSNNPPLMAFSKESGRHILYDFHTKSSPVLDCKFIKGSSLLFAAGYFKTE